MRIMNAAVHSHAAHRVIVVGSISNEQHIAYAKSVGNAAVNAIHLGGEDVKGDAIAYFVLRIASAVVDKVCQTLLQGGWGRCLATIFFVAEPKNDAGEVGQTKHDDPLFGVKNVVDGSEIGVDLVKIVIGANEQKAVLVGRANEGKAKLLARDAMGAICAD